MITYGNEMWSIDNELIDKILGELFLEDIIVSSYDVDRAREIINGVLGDTPHVPTES